MKKAKFLIPVLACASFTHPAGISRSQVRKPLRQAPAFSGRAIAGKPVPINGFETGTYGWAHMDASPSKPGTIMVCGMRTIPSRNAAEGYIYLSADYGETWRQVFVDASTAWVSEESCAFGPDGQAYFLSSSSAMFHGLPHHNLGRSRLYGSSDDGSTWSVMSERPFVDYSSIAVERTPTASRPRVYVFGNDIDTTDPTSGPGLLTIDPEADNSDAVHSVLLEKREPLGQVFSAAPDGSVVLENGTAVAVFHTSRSSAVGPRPWTKTEMIRECVEFVRSHDNGQTLDSPVQVSTPEGFSQLSEPTLAADRSTGPHGGRLYVAWAQNSATHIIVMLATSDNAGISWRRRRVETLDDRPRLLGLGSYPGLTPPAVAVNNQGTVGLFWVDRSGRCPYFSESRNGGERFEAKVHVATCEAPPSDLNWYGHYLFAWPASEASEQGAERDEGRVGVRIEMRVQSLSPTSMVSDDRGDFHPMWLALRQGGSQLRTATMTPTDRLHTKPALPEGLVDISNSAALEFGSTQFDARSRTFSVDVMVVNRGADTLDGPLFLQPTRITSSLGRVAPIDRVVGPVASCKAAAISYRVNQERIATGARTIPVRVSVTLRRLRRTDSGDVDLSLRVCGRRE